ncbi:hypothetical protein FPHYL_6345 [Fusarium phyllophilum]|uniref:Uncharacterized protein n=1 Tax=Fusarium phyllophilum TaxID=47803 RepID=A0A8H5NCM7_9HYPO|nr:hypothetical protein FPHYL_6345 [Fusarium phyllophilum]
MDFQRMRDEMRHAQQRNLYLERKVEEETQKRHNAERHKQALQDQLNEKSDQLRDAVTHLGESRRYARGLEGQLRQMQAYITHHQQISVQIAELEKQHKALNAKRQQCINIMADQSSTRIEGSNAATKRPAAGSADGKGFKRPRQN